MINKIYILHNISKVERGENMLYQIDNLGLCSSSDIVWKFTTPNIFKETYYNNHIKNKKIFTYGMFDCALGHYEIMKEALALGYERIMIWEDDIVFHDDFKKYMKNIPIDADLILCEYNSLYLPLNFFHKNKNELFLPYTTHYFFHTGGYIVNRNYMEYYTKKQEIHFTIADEYLHKIPSDKDDNLKRYVTNKPIILQIPDGNALGDKCNYSHLPISSYIRQDVNFEDYTLTEKQKDYMSKIDMSQFKKKRRY